MKAFSIHVFRLKNDQRGTALIELAVVLPILLTICLGVFEFGNAIYGRHLIENGVRDASRYAAGLANGSANNNVKCIALTGGIQSASCVPGSSPSCTTACRVSWLNNANMISVVFTQLSDNGKVYCGTAATPAYCRGRDTSGNIYVVTVSADVPYSGFGFLGYFGLSNFTMHVEHKERLFGVR